MKKIISVIVALLSINNIFAQNAYQNVLDSIANNSSVLEAHFKQMNADKLENDAYALFENPEVEAAYKFGHPKDEVGNKVEFGISQSIDFPTVYTNTNKIIKINDLIFDIQYQIERTNILTEAQKICTELIFCKMKIKLYKQNYDNAVKIADAYQKMMDAGEANILDFNKSKMHLANAKNNYELELIHCDNLMSSLKTMNGGKDVDFQYEDYDLVTLPENFDEWYQFVENSNPIFEQMRQRIALSHQEVKLSKSEWFPSLNIGYGGEVGQDEASHGPRIGLSLPLWHNKGSVKSAKMKAEATETLLASEKAVTYNYLNGLYAKAKALQNNIANLAVSLQEFDSQNLLLKAFEKGEMSLIDYVGEVEFYQDAMLELYSAQYEMNATMIELKSYEGIK